MAPRRWLPLGALALALLGALGAARRTSAPAEAPAQAEPGDAHSVRGLLFAQAFRLERPYAHAWRAEQPQVAAGWLLVLAVDPAVAVRRQLAEPLLIVGGQTAERVNDGELSGRLVVIVPAPLEAAGGRPAGDPRRQRAWFGQAALPEATDAAALRRMADAARSAGVPLLGDAAHTRAGALAGELLELSDRTSLERHAAGLVLAWSPQERELAEGLLAPLVR